MPDYTEQAIRAERDLNSYQAKQGLGRQSDSTLDSGVNEMAGRKFQQDSDIRYGRGAAASTGSDRKPISENEGGDYDDRGRLSRAKDFNGPGGPEDNARNETMQRPGDDDVLAPQELKHKGI